MKMRTLLIILFFASTWSMKAQSFFSAKVIDAEGNALPGATVYWKIIPNMGVMTDSTGNFTLLRPDTTQPLLLEIKHMSYAQVEVEILPNENQLQLLLEKDALVQEVEITRTKRDAFRSTLEPLNIETLSACELKRAACCSLAESFENNGTVNVSFSDAVTGAREIEMLGLRGIYTQMLIENRPSLNRLGRAFGLEYIPGSWIETIQISKGASTVRNGVQGITGQINTELIKPSKTTPFYVNLYANPIGRFELNSNVALKLNKNWSTGLLLHGNIFQSPIDHNHDYFLDLPYKKQINGLWRLFQESDKLHFELNLQALIDDRFGGQVHDLYHVDSIMPIRMYEIKNEAKRAEAFGKIGFIGFKNPLMSLAFVWSAGWHDQKGIYGDRIHKAEEKSLYGNLIFQSPLDKAAKHNMNCGLNYQLDDYKESFSDLKLDRMEQISSAFVEYDFSTDINKEKGSSIGFILGSRIDWIQTANLSEWIPSPRVNIKYNPSDNLIFRLSGGRGVRMPNALIENIRYMPGNRSFILSESFQPEIAWNMGGNMTYNFSILNQEGSISLDLYRTEFENQLVVDVDQQYQSVIFYNLKGRSFSNSLLFAWTQDLFKGFELRLAYKYNDVRATYNGQLLWQTFSPMHRGLIALHYITPNKGWQFNANMQLTGPQRLPQIEGDLSDLERYRRESLSPTFVLFNAQVTKYFKNGFEVYIGVENIGNYTQSAPIIGADNPFGNLTGARTFDATSVYGPVMGFMAYAGFRYSFVKKNNKDTDAKTTQDVSHAHENLKEVRILTNARCEMCVETIQTKLVNTEGVYHAKLNLSSAIVHIEYDSEKLDLNQLRKIITELGYNADRFTANQAAREKLPACCKVH